jgi:hypothetical protein
MVHVNTERLLAEVSAQVSAIDGIQYNVYTPEVSAFLGTFVEFMQKQMTRVLSPSATLISGTDASTVTVTVATGIGTGGASTFVSGIVGIYQGWPFQVLSAGSGPLTSLASTTSVTARKVLVTMAISDLPVASSLATVAGTLQFVYGSVYATSALAASTGGVSAIYNKIPLPKASAGEIPVGWINVPNSQVSGMDIDNTMMITDYREIQGFDFSAILGTVEQP